VEEVVKISGKIQIKAGVPQILADDITKLEIVSDAEKNDETANEYMGIIVPDEKADDVDGILDILDSYPGDIPVIIAMKGKKYDAHTSIRKCDGLKSELKAFMAGGEVIFFRKK